jgi:long-chain fatty acid transport protein
MHNATMVGPLLLAGGALMLAEAQAGGFQITELSARTQGLRTAGAAALADDAATVWFNPAGLARLPGKQLDASSHFFKGSFKFRDRGTLTAIGTGGNPPTPMEGQQVNDAGEFALIPNFYYTQQLNDQTTFGIGVNSPYGLVTDYDDDWVGRYHAVRSDLLTLNINPSVGYRVNERLSLGAGVNIAYVDAELSNAVDVGTIVTTLLPGPAAALGLNPGTLNSDGFTRLTGDDWGFGFNLGALYELSEATRLGVSYRSKLKTTVEGTLKTTLPDTLVDSAIGASLGLESTSKVGGEADLTLPATANLGLYHRLNERWALMAGATWTQWSSFDELRIKLDDGGQIVQPEDWKNVWRYNIGVEFEQSPQWTFRGGLEFDETPVSGVSNNTARIPDVDRKFLALGGSYKPAKQLSIDFAYTRIFASEYRIDEKEVITSQAGALIGDALPPAVLQRLDGVGTTLEGKYSASADIVTVGLRYRF